MSGVVCFIITIISTFLTVSFFLSFLLKKVPLDSLVLSFSITAVFFLGWVLSKTKFWKIATYIPPFVMFFAALYGICVGGPGAPAIAMFVLSIILAAVLIGERFQFIFMILSVVSFIVVYFLFLSGSLTNVRTVETSALNRIIIIISTYMSSSFLLWFLVKQFKITLEKTDVYLKEIIRVNKDLKNEIEERKNIEKDRERIQAQLFQIQKMEAIGALAGGIAHDFNNNLTAILGFSDLISLKIDSDCDFARDVEEIKKAALRSSELTRQLLEFSRKQMINPVIFNINDLVENLKKMLKRLVGENINIIISEEKNIKTIKFDKGQLEQVIINLVVNARDAMPDGGEILIETQNVSVSKRSHYPQLDMTEGNYVLLSISDVGKGMSEETKSHIFEPFYTTKEVGKGTGLGLATVYGIVKQHSGYIFVYSEEGSGTVIKIYIPISGENISEIESVVTKEGSLKGSETILVVEDEESIREFIKRVLSEYGYNVLVTDGSQKALDIFSKNKEEIDLLLTDIVLKEKTNGKDLFESLSSLKKTLKVLYMSGYSDNIVARRGVLEKNINFIQKPFSIENFLKKIRSTLD
ncbi:MAG TPA: ATP-binding protein [Spirochaetota bacterium]|nr:ATP-binding protein [Spirochaetota bacterium]